MKLQVYDDAVLVWETDIPDIDLSDIDKMHRGIEIEKHLWHNYGDVMLTVMKRVARPKIYYVLESKIR